MIAATISPNAAIAISARRKVEERSVLARSTETISDAADGVDQRIGLGIIDLAADATDIDVDDVGGGIEVQIPDMLEQHRTRDDAALVADEIFEQLEFPRQQRNLPAAAARAPRDQVDGEIADPQDRLLGNGVAAPAECLQPRQQFGEGERLDEIIVAAGAQAAHAVVDLAKCGNDQERRGDAVVAQLAHHADAVDVGQHAVDGDHGIVARGAVAEGFAPRGGEIDVVARNRQLLDELACGFRIVLDDQNAAVTSGHDKLRATIATRLSRSGAERNRPMTIATMVRYGDASTKSLRTH